MKLCYSGCACKYETEAVMKLFLPAQKFGFAYEEALPREGDFAFFRRRVTGRHTLLWVIVSYDGGRRRAASRLSPEADEKECGEELCRLLYKAMSALTGITSEWGVLTGVRPVKQVHRLMAQGLGRDEIAERLAERYFVSWKKSRLACDTAAAQKPMLEALAKRGNTFGLYVSVPFCPTRCSYCSFISQSAQGAAVKKLIPPYIENLCEEIRRTAGITEALGMKPDTVYFGGGTPTTFTAAQLTRIMETLAKCFDLSGVLEYTVEAGRPDTITEEKLAAIKAHGCDRVSINPQTLNDDVLREIGRAHTTEQFFESYALAEKVGFRSINCDVIAGLPTDTAESFARTIDGLTALSPGSITVHTLSIKRSARLNSEGDKRAVMRSPAGEMTDLAADKLRVGGYHPYYMYRQKNMVENLENIGWVRDGHESLYNIYIMEEVQPIIAVGAAASTKLIDRKGRLERIFGYKYPHDYNEHFDTVLKRKDEIRDFYAEKK